MRYGINGEQRALHKTVANVGVGARSQQSFDEIGMAAERGFFQCAITVVVDGVGVAAAAVGGARGVMKRTKTKQKNGSERWSRSCCICTLKNRNKIRAAATTAPDFTHLVISCCATATCPPAAAFIRGVQPMSSLQRASWQRRG